MRSMLCLAAAVSILCLAVPGMAQQGHLALYADPEGTQSRIDAHPGMPTDVYLVLHTEDLVKAVAFDLVAPRGVFFFPKSFGPHGRGLNAPTPGGYNVGLGECCSGGGGTPILVGTFTIITVTPSMPTKLFCGPNRDLSTHAAIYVRCGTNEMIESTFGPPPSVITDFEPPRIRVDLSRHALWPENYKMVDIETSVAVQDDVDPSPGCCLASVTCDEGSDGIEGVDCGVLDTSFRLCAEWDGDGPGRAYSITYRASDASGNVAERVVDVEVSRNLPGTIVRGPGMTDTGLVQGASFFTVVIPSTVKDGKPIAVTLTTEPEDLWGGLSPRYDFNAAALPVERIAIGNTAGIVKPLDHTIRDTNGDRALDLMLVFETAPVQALLDLTKCDDGPVGFYYETSDGVDYLILDLFDTMSRQAHDPLVGAAKQAAPRTSFLEITPNPFNPATKAIFSVSHEQLVRIDVYDVRGRLVRRLEDRIFPVGLHEVAWDGQDDSSRSVASGVYVFAMQSEDLQQFRKALLLR